jgi:hypothetical protein
MLSRLAALQRPPLIFLLAAVTKRSGPGFPRPPHALATYQRLLDQYDELQNRWGIGMMSMVSRLGSRLKRR